MKKKKKKKKKLGTLVIFFKEFSKENKKIKRDN